LFSNVTRHLIPGQHPFVLTPIARALCFMMVASKS
jgi:hypothetical protein